MRETSTTGSSSHVIDVFFSSYEELFVQQIVTHLQCSLLLVCRKITLDEGSENDNMFPVLFLRRRRRRLSWLLSRLFFFFFSSLSSRRQERAGASICALSLLALSFAFLLFALLTQLVFLLPLCE